MSEEEIKGLLIYMKNQLECNGLVRKISNNDGNELYIELNGDHRDKVTEILIDMNIVYNIDMVLSV